MRERLEVVSDVASAFYLHLEVADRPGVLAAITEVLGDNEVSVKSVVQWGLGDDARLVMVMHEAPRAGSRRRWRRSRSSSSCAHRRARSA